MVSRICSESDFGDSILICISMQKLMGRNGRLLGFLKTITKYQQAIYDRGGRLLGWYNPVINKTFAYNGSLVGFGDLRSGLLKDTL